MIKEMKVSEIKKLFPLEDFSSSFDLWTIRKYSSFDENKSLFVFYSKRYNKAILADGSDAENLIRKEERLYNINSLGIFKFDKSKTDTYFLKFEKFLKVAKFINFKKFWKENKKNLDESYSQIKKIVFHIYENIEKVSLESVINYNGIKVFNIKDVCYHRIIKFDDNLFLKTPFYYSVNQNRMEKINEEEHKNPEKYLIYLILLVCDKKVSDKTKDYKMIKNILNQNISNKDKYFLINCLI
jgi:hypothetical protein